MPSEMINTLLIVTDVLEEMGIPYFVVGSIASSILGKARSTNDADIVVALDEKNACAFIGRFSGDFYIDETAALNSVRRKRSFNLIYNRYVFKVDIFVFDSEDEFAASQMKRRKKVTICDEPKKEIYVASAEDTVLAKLLWYKKGGCVSEKQWSDVTDILRINKGFLEEEYLNKTAAEIGVAELLKKARKNGRH